MASTSTTTTTTHSKHFEKVKYYYNMRFWTLNMTKNAVTHNWITADEFKEITGEDYTAPAES